jgi:murein DD-endopeptidase MepM/ murein hydrolase activator NlpD
VIEKKPIRKDRIFLVVLSLVAIILIPILLRSGQSPKEPVLPEILSPREVESAPETAAEASPPEPIDSEELASPSMKILAHTMSEGETLSGIASSLGVTVDQIMASNRIFSSQSIQAGQTLRVPEEGILHLVKKGQTLTDISLTYAVPIGEITSINAITDPGKIYAGQEIIIPHGDAHLWETVIRLSLGRETRFIYPLMGEIVSPFGWRVHPVLGHRHRHNGIDFDVPTGTTVHAAAMGTVYTVGEKEGYGTWIVLEHQEGYYTAYGHLSTVFVNEGQFVETGQPIAESGNSGISSGPHLHFEVRHGEFPIDPLRYLP